ncbi:MAG TPA: RraA family protein [Candidatus Methylomirabilis sp.]|jgi:regulator of RNase E activity RraA|nr:RraA family protein [Candidatus Methylomirabilis sp.]
MPAGPLSFAILEDLRRLSSPTVANAIETFNYRSRAEGFMRAEIRCMFPELPPLVGYAATARIMAGRPPGEGRRIPPERWWDYLLTLPEPRVVVMQDLDRPSLGAFWGEVQANIHRALGCAGTITDGGVRDLVEVAALGFAFFAAHVQVSHAYVHLVDFGGPVSVGGLLVQPGDLLHADRHGVVQVPLDLAAKIPDGAAAVERQEREIIGACQAPDFTPERLKTTWRRVRG